MMDEAVASLIRDSKRPDPRRAVDAYRGWWRLEKKEGAKAEWIISTKAGVPPGSLVVIDSKRGQSVWRLGELLRREGGFSYWRRAWVKLDHGD